MSNARVTLEIAAHVARLARLRLAPEELERLRADLERILGYVDQLQAVDVNGAPPTMHVLDAALPLRDDGPPEALAHDVALREAPVKEEGLFAVPKVIDV